MKALNEFIGTFLFLFVISLAAPLAGPMAPIGIGFALIAMVYMGAGRSGSHYNPAVSIAFWTMKAITAAELVQYLAAQIFGGLLAFYLGHVITGMSVRLAPGGPHPSAASAFLVEVIFTFLLMIVVLNVAVSKKSKAGSAFGLAIGAAIIGAVIAGGPISGGAYNPAVGLCATAIDATLGGGTWEHVWIVTLGPILGAWLATLAYNAQENAAD